MKTKRAFSLIIDFALLLAATCLIYSYCLHPATVTEGNFRCRLMEVPGGYGYAVTSLPTDDTLIVQPYIPALGGYAPFETKEEALETGRLVCRKLAGGENPTVSREEVEEIQRNF